jgi:hypothetical protein
VRYIRRQGGTSRFSWQSTMNVRTRSWTCDARFFGIFSSSGHLVGRRYLELSNDTKQLALSENGSSKEAPSQGYNVCVRSPLALRHYHSKQYVTSSTAVLTRHSVQLALKLRHEEHKTCLAWRVQLLELLVGYPSATRHFRQTLIANTRVVPGTGAEQSAAPYEVETNHA